MLSEGVAQKVQVQMVHHVIAKQATSTLLHCVKVWNADLATAMMNGVRGTQAHVGLLELAQSASDELSRRGYRAGAKADGTDLPVDVQWEDGCKLSFAIRVF